MNVNLIEKILMINAHKQEQTCAQISLIQEAEHQKDCEIKDAQQDIEMTKTELYNYKQTTYKEQLTNTRLTWLQINQIRLNKGKIKLALSDAHDKYDQLILEREQLQEQVNRIQQHRKLLQIKEAKFNYIIQEGCF